jgi:hypothetical protein
MLVSKKMYVSGFQRGNWKGLWETALLFARKEIDTNNKRKYNCAKRDTSTIWVRVVYVEHCARKGALSKANQAITSTGRNCATQSKMCSAQESRGYLSARSSTRCIHEANCSIASPLGVTLAMRKSRSSKRRSVSNNSLRKAKDPNLVRLSTRSPGRVGMSAKIAAAEAGAGGLCEGRGGCGREEGDGREEGAAAPLEVLQALPLVVEDLVASALLCRLFTKLST